MTVMANTTLCKKRIIGLLSIVLLVAGTLLRILYLGKAAFGADQLEFYKLAVRGVGILEIWRNPLWLNQIPLSETLSLMLIKLGLPPTPFVVRLPFAIMGILVLLMLWRWVSSRYGRTVGCITLLLAAFNPYHVYHSRTAYFYSGVIFGASLMLLTFWPLKLSLQKRQCPHIARVSAWLLATVFACHMHMSVWAFALAQGLLLAYYAFKGLKQDRSRMFRFLCLLGGGGLFVLAVMARWILRGIERLRVASEGGKGLIGGDGAEELRRLIPAYFAGESFLGLITLAAFVFLIGLGCLSRNAYRRKEAKSFYFVSLIQLAVVVGYVLAAGGGLAKITYFSTFWPFMMVSMSLGAFYGFKRLIAYHRRSGYGVLIVCLALYAGLTIPPSFAMLFLDGKPLPTHTVNDWVINHLDEGTPILVDRWFHPWNELAIHNEDHINYTFTVPDEPIENYIRLDWRKTAEAFFERFPDAAFLEVNREKYDDYLGPWDFPETHFAQTAYLTNEAAMVMRQFHVYPTGSYNADNTNQIVTRIFYNTKEDNLEAARERGDSVFRYYEDGWGYAKPGWQHGRYEDFRVMQGSATFELWNLRSEPVKVNVNVIGVAPQDMVLNIEGHALSFRQHRIESRQFLQILQVGRNSFVVSSTFKHPFLVYDITATPLE